MRRGLTGLLVALACTTAWPGTALGQQESAENLVSELNGIRPQVSGLELEVIERDRFLRLANETGKTVVVVGYDDEPFLRFRPDGRVEVNDRSPSKYVSEDRFGRRPVPARADSSAPPRWQQVSDNGSYQWFDHRIHYMAPGTPEEVTDEGERTEVFDWTVPLRVDARPARAVGTLVWEPDEEESDSNAAVFIIGGIGVLIALAIAASLIRRGRQRTPTPAAESKPSKDAW